LKGTDFWQPENFAGWMDAWRDFSCHYHMGLQHGASGSQYGVLQTLQIEQEQLAKLIEVL